MKRSIVAGMLACAFAVLVMFAGCTSGTSSQVSQVASGSSADVPSTSASSSSHATSIEPGTYSVKFETDSSMFHVNEADEGRAKLEVSDDGMTVHIRLVSKKITKLYLGTTSQASADEAGALLPTTDTVTFDDGTTKEVYGFDVPVPSLDEPFDVAILGSKDKWYDHKVTVSDPIKE